MVMKVLVMYKKNRTVRILAASQGNQAPWSKLAGSRRTAMLSRALCLAADPGLHGILAKKATSRAQ